MSVPEHTLDLQAGVKEYQIGAQTAFDTPTVDETKRSCGRRCYGQQCISDRPMRIVDGMLEG